MARFFRYLTFIAVSIGTSCLTAQVNEPEWVTLKFSAFSLTSLEGVNFEAKPGKKPTAIRFYSTNRSPKYEYQGPNPIGFFGEETSSIDLMSKIRVPLATARILKGVQEPLFLFFPASEPQKGQPQYNIYVIDDSRKNFPEGHILFFNASGVYLEGLVGRQRLTLGPGLSPIFPVDKTIEVNFKILFRERYYNTYSNVIGLDENTRALILLFPPYYAGSWMVQPRLLREKVVSAISPDSTR